jgi:Tfp pilus assembly protein PilX
VEDRKFVSTIGRRSPERGSTVALAMIVMTALSTLAGVTLVMVKGGISTVSNDRFHTLAMYAAESGGAAAMDFLRANVDPNTGWKAFISANNSALQTPAGIAGNTIPSGSAGNLLGPDTQGWYTVQVLNNRTDTGFTTGDDNDKRVVIRSTGYGPNGATATIEWEVGAGVGTLGTPCSEYAQRGMAENGGGGNDCLGAINQGDSATMRPGG